MDNLSLWIKIIDQGLHTRSKVHQGAPVCDFHMTPIGQRLKEHEEIGRTSALVFRIIP
jgi:hypothetical protein